MNIKIYLRDKVGFKTISQTYLVDKL